jgi:hypothetical protein
MRFRCVPRIFEDRRHFHGFLLNCREVRPGGKDVRLSVALLNQLADLNRTATLQEQRYEEMMGHVTSSRSLFLFSLLILGLLTSRLAGALTADSREHLYMDLTKATPEMARAGFAALLHGLGAVEGPTFEEIIERTDAFGTL